MTRFALLALVAASLPGPFSHAQAEPNVVYTRSNTVSIFTEYSNDSGHIVLGRAADRKLVALGFSYSHRILVNHVVDWQYGFELRPVVLLRSPTEQLSVVITGPNGAPPVTAVSSGLPLQKCTSQSYQFPPGPVTVSVTYVCGSQWTYAGGLSPLGQRVNFGPRRRIQPFLAENAGFLVAPRDIPVNDSSRFNFTFQFGAGVEFYRESGRSVALEYCVHHLSNAATGDNNPGIDNGTFKLTYSFGR